MALQSGRSCTLLAGRLKHITRIPQLRCLAALGSNTRLHDRLVTSRRTFERLAPEPRFSIAGVTFEGRQESIRDLRQGQRVLLVKEPGNPYDPHAVQVLTLTGQSLGYVPRPDPQKRVRGDCTNKDITLGMQIGCVASVGQVQDPPDGPWGATVFTQPGLISLTADPLPPAKRQPALQQFVQKCSSENSRLVRQALEVAQGSCEVTGVPGGSGGSAGEQLVPMPVWHWDSHNKVVRLATLAMVHPGIMNVKTELNAAVSSAHTGQQLDKAAADLICDINGWSHHDLVDHIGWAGALEQRMDTEGWEVKLDI